MSEIPRLGEGPPPCAPSAARSAIRQFIIDDVFGGAEIPVDGSAGLIADMISYALERRGQAKLYEISALLVDINNLLDLVVDQQLDRWDRITMDAIYASGPYVGVGWKNPPDQGLDEVLAIAITGKPDDDESERLAQFIEAMPALLRAIRSCLREPL